VYNIYGLSGGGLQVSDVFICIFVCILSFLCYQLQPESQIFTSRCMYPINRRYIHI